MSDAIFMLFVVFSGNDKCVDELVFLLLVKFQTQREVFSLSGTIQHCSIVNARRLTAFVKANCVYVFTYILFSFMSELGCVTISSYRCS